MFWKKIQYMDWAEYTDIVSTWDAIAFAQHTRESNIRNSPGLGQIL